MPCRVDAGSLLRQKLDDLIRFVSKVGAVSALRSRVQCASVLQAAVPCTAHATCGLSQYGMYVPSSPGDMSQWTHPGAVTFMSKLPPGGPIRQDAAAFVFNKKAKTCASGLDAFSPFGRWVAKEVGAAPLADGRECDHADCTAFAATWYAGMLGRSLAHGGRVRMSANASPRSGPHGVSRLPRWSCPMSPNAHRALRCHCRSQPSARPNGPGPADQLEVPRLLGQEEPIEAASALPAGQETVQAWRRGLHVCATAVPRQASIGHVLAGRAPRR